MAVLGVGGILELRRELPETVLLSAAAVNASANAMDVGTDAIWTGDKVWVWGPVGLPFDLNGDGEPDVRSGWGMFYGSQYLLYGERRRRLTSGSAKWFGPEAPFKAPEIAGLTDRIALYVFRDQLDRISFYRTMNAALGGEPEDRLAFFAVDFRLLLVAPEGSTGYQQRLEPAYPALANYRLPEDTTEVTLSSVTNAAIPEPQGPDSNRPWVFVGEMEDWTLELDAREVDINGIGERFGESTRAMVTGGGSLNFFFNRYQNGAEIDATYLARLLITLEQGSAAEAIFNVTSKKSDIGLPAGYRRDPTANVSYRSKLLLVSSATNTAADDLIRGSARFVTVGRVRLDIS